MFNTIKINIVQMYLVKKKKKIIQRKSTKQN